MYVIENGTRKPFDSKTKTAKKFPRAATAKQLQSFLGLIGYFRKFIPNYAKITKPLRDLLRKVHCFKFEKEHLEALNELKKYCQ